MRYFWILAATLLLLGGCAKEDIEPAADDSQRDEFSVFTRADNNTSEYDISDTPKPLDKELINNWVVFFIKRSSDSSEDGTIRLVESGKPSQPGEDFSFKVKVPDGTYDIVGFGNMDQATVIGLMGLTDVSDFNGCIGGNIRFSDIKGKTVTIANNGYAGDTELIPMSGYREGVSIENNNETGGGHGGKKNVIELIRMVTKTTVRIKNTASKDITVTEILFGVLNKGVVPLLPTYSILGSNGSEGAQPEIKSGNTTETASVTIPASAATIAAGKDQEFTFYGRESVANHSSGKFVVKLSYTTNGIEGQSSFWVPTSKIEWINRNDWIRIPITVSDYTVDWEVLFYPPIGGYPAVMTDPAATDFTFYATFASAGNFEIRATLRDGDRKPVYANYVSDLDNTTIFPAYTVAIDNNSITGDKSIFETSPYVSANTGEILGELSGTVGQATVPVTITFKTSPDAEKIIRERNISIKSIKKE